MNKYFLVLISILHANAKSFPPTSSIDPEEITKLLDDAEPNPKWSHILNRNILYNDKYQVLKSYIDSYDRSTGKIQNFNVLNILKKYVQDDDMVKKVSVDVMRDLIQDATNCAGLIDTNLFAILILKDLLFLEALDNHSTLNIVEDAANIKHKIIRCAKVYDEFYMNFNIVTENGEIKFNGMGRNGQLQENKLEMHSTWKNTIRKRSTLDIDYRIELKEFNSVVYPEVVAEPLIKNLLEVISVLILAVRNTDEKLQESCVAHNGSFVKKYESLSDQLGEEFVQFIKEVDENKDANTDCGEFCYFFSQLDDTANETKSDDKEKSNNGPAKTTTSDPFFIRRANFQDENITISLEITDEKEAEEYSRFMNTIVRKLTFSTSFENDLSDQAFNKKESNKENSNDKKDSDAYYHFKGTVNVSLS